MRERKASTGADLIMPKGVNLISELIARREEG